jgi:CBS domain-containing protein
MAATFGAAARAPFTAIVFAVELTHDMRAAIPLMVATVAAELVGRALLDHGLMSEKLARRGVLVPHEFEPDALRHTLVRAAMSSPVVSVPGAATVAEARRIIENHPHSAYPLVDDDGRLAGMLDRTALPPPEEGDDARARVVGLTREDVPTVGPDDTLDVVLDRIVDARLDHVPVVDGEGRLIGVCTRTDLLVATAGRRERHHIEPATFALRLRVRRDRERQ